MRSTPLSEGEPWPRLCPSELGSLKRLRRKQPSCKSFRVQLQVLSGRRPGLRAPPTPPDAPTAAWDPRGAALRAAASAPPPPPAASAAASRPPPPPPAAASPRPRASEAAGVSPEIKALQQTRRLLANARERTRVHTISAAFEALRKQVAAGRLARLSVCPRRCCPSCRPQPLSSPLRGAATPRGGRWDAGERLVWGAGGAGNAWKPQPYL
ncbi:Protein atonal-like protein 8 [Aix galericulata]|nr:Protein atonal-like protein 8 [Aix galericulata]